MTIAKAAKRYKTQDRSLNPAYLNLLLIYTPPWPMMVNIIIAVFQHLVNNFFGGSKLNHKCITIDRMNMRLVSLNQDRFRDKWRVFRVSFYPSAMALSGELSR